MRAEAILDGILRDSVRRLTSPRVLPEDPRQDQDRCRVASSDMSTAGQLNRTKEF